MRRDAYTCVKIAGSLAALLVVAFLGQSILPYFRARFVGTTERPANEIVIWHPWGGTIKELLEKTIKEFEKAHPGIRVKPVFVPNNISNNQKFFTAVAAKRAPDVVFVDGTQVSEWASQGALESLDDYVRKAGIRPSDFFVPCWKQCFYDGHVWALTHSAAPNFAFSWNKEAFRKAGLDPDKPPTTIAELDEVAGRLTKENDGNLESIGIIPWGQYGGANSLYTWGWAFGGEFYDEKRRKITLNDPKNVKALEWMCSYAKRYGITKISGMAAGFGTLEQNPFYTGQLGMSCMLIDSLKDIRMYAPKLDFGLGYMPYPPGGEARSSWIGGWCLGLPKGGKHPELGWEFIRWMCADPEGTTIMSQTCGTFTSYRKSPFFKTIKPDSRYYTFLQLLKSCRHQRPVIPVEAYYFGAMDRAVEAALYGLKTPKQALDDATVETQRELDLKLAVKHGQ